MVKSEGCCGQREDGGSTKWMWQEVGATVELGWLVVAVDGWWVKMKRRRRRETKASEGKRSYLIEKLHFVGGFFYFVVENYVTNLKTH